MYIVDRKGSDAIIIRSLECKNMLFHQFVSSFSANLSKWYKEHHFLSFSIYPKLINFLCRKIYNLFSSPSLYAYSVIHMCLALIDSYKTAISRKTSPLNYPENSWLFLKRSKKAICKNLKPKHCREKIVYILAKDVHSKRKFYIKAKII